MTARGGKGDKIPPKYLLRLYIAGATPKSLSAVENVARICDARLSGRFELEVVDLVKHPEEAAVQNVVVTPVLVKALPGPVRRTMGDLSDTAKVLLALGIEEEGS